MLYSRRSLGIEDHGLIGRNPHIHSRQLVESTNIVQIWSTTNLSLKLSLSDSHLSNSLGLKNPCYHYECLNSTALLHFSVCFWYQGEVACSHSYIKLSPEKTYLHTFASWIFLRLKLDIFCQPAFLPDFFCPCCFLTVS